MMLKKLLPLAFLLMLIIGGIAQAQDALPPLPECQYHREGVFSYPNFYPGYYDLEGIVPRHEIRNRRLVLANPLTGEEVRIIETSFDATRIEWYSWSPGCRYMFAQVDYIGYVWDIVENRRIATIDDAAVIEAPHWNPQTSTPTMLLHIGRGNFCGMWGKPSRFC
jgi:hypothetical protein